MKFGNSRKREKSYYDLLNERYGPFPKCEHTDNPDFLIHFSDHILGIECTEIYNQDKINGIPLRQHEAIKDRIVKKAKQYAIENNLPPIHVGVFFNGFVKKDREEIVTNALIQAIRENYPLQPGQKIDIGGHASSYPLPNEIIYIIAKNISGCTKHSWFAEESGFVDTDFSGQLQTIINCKAEKHENYSKRCDKCWLIIAALGTSASSFYEPSEEMIKHLYLAPFERIFFVEAFSRDIVELKIKM